MTTREKILDAVLKNQPATTALPDISSFKGTGNDLVQNYAAVFRSIGGSCFLADNLEDVFARVRAEFDNTKRIVTTLPGPGHRFELIQDNVDPHTYDDIELAIISAHFAVAENGAVWVSEEVMGQRIIPYICQHLAVIVQAQHIVPTLHEAYERIGTGDYGFGGFIGGPSKTADIEQALVLGAHGPLTMTVFIIQ
jgi:L-lactate dehydrogenase complex protein LldG